MVEVNQNKILKELDRPKTWKLYFTSEINE